ncbi:hypothetical protein AB0F46_42160 [Streptomyces sp. NPDC026665]|uniref:hypothetical protein n=1 Tax=Streptomyces sp. NPDC026665 TaxID=3154798 RepID=UPI0033F15D2A
MHESLHIAAHREYEKPDGEGLEFVNMHLPQDPESSKFQASMSRQAAAIDGNLERLRNTAASDPGLNERWKQYVVRRIDEYARVMPEVHYESVTAEIAETLLKSGLQNTVTYQKVAAFTRDALKRQQNHSAREVQPYSTKEYAELRSTSGSAYVNRDHSSSSKVTYSKTYFPSTTSSHSTRSGKG